MITKQFSAPIANSSVNQVQVIASPKNLQGAVAFQDSSSAPPIIKKPKIFNLISIIFFLLAISYIIATIFMLGVMIIVGQTLSTQDLVLPFLKYFPFYGFVPILLSLMTLFLFYVAIKIRNGSRPSYWLGIGTLVGVPLLGILVSQMLMTPFVNYANKVTETGSEVAPSKSINPDSLLFGNPSYILIIITLILMIIAFRKFQFSNDPISTKSKFFLILLTVILILPTVSLVVLGYIKANDTDFGYTTAQSQVTYHIYKPMPIPAEMVNATKFTVGEELARKQNAVRVIYDVPFDTLMEADQPEPIIMKQVGVETDFELDTFATTYMEDATIQKISLPIAVSQTGYLIQKKSENLILSAIIFLTSDNVLITLVSPRASSDELIDFSSYLK